MVPSKCDTMTEHSGTANYVAANFAFSLIASADIVLGSGLAPKGDYYTTTLLHYTLQPHRWMGCRHPDAVSYVRERTAKHHVKITRCGERENGGARAGKGRNPSRSVSEGRSLKESAPGLWNPCRSESVR